MFSDIFILSTTKIRNDTDRSTAERLRQVECATSRKATGTLPHATPRHRTHRCTNGAQTRRRHGSQNSVDGIALGSFRRLRSIEDRPQESSVKSTRWEGSLAGRVVCAGRGTRERERERERKRTKKTRKGKIGAREKEKEREKQGEKDRLVVRSILGSKSGVVSVLERTVPLLSRSLLLLLRRRHRCCSLPG